MELATKLEIIREALAAHRLAAVRLRANDWFAWATCGGSNGVFLATERDNAAKSVSRPSILRVELGADGASTTTHEWNLTSVLGELGANLGPEAIEWISDADATRLGVMGDSAGGPQCADITFQTELDSFRAAYRHLTDDLHVPADRIVMLGHSLGALEAPLLADERAPRGIAVYGAVLRNWADYHQQLASVQRFLIDGTDPGKNYAEGEQA